MSSVAAPSPPAAAARPAAGERGTTTVADRVIVAVAARAAAEVPGIAAAGRRVLGRTVDTARPDRAPGVVATIAGDTVALRLRLSVLYPTPVRAATERVRRNVAERVGTLTGKTVGVIDISVESLPVPAAPRRVVQ
jgi:uncharacterized alkaline shock family protein YloU